MELMMEEDDDVRPANLFPCDDGDGDGDGGRGGVGITIIRHVADECRRRRNAPKSRLRMVASSWLHLFRRSTTDAVSWRP